MIVILLVYSIHLVGKLDTKLKKKKEDYCQRTFGRSNLYISKILKYFQIYKIKTPPVKLISTVTLVVFQKTLIST